MDKVRDRNLDREVYILGGITPLKSSKMAEYMNSQVAGMDIPEEVIRRMKAVPAKEQRREGLKISIETIQALKEMKGIHGVHIMAIEGEEAVPQIVEGAGLYPRPTFRCFFDTNRNNVNQNSKRFCFGHLNFDLVLFRISLHGI
jgi:methylenetetrahydrofolate reductase (NADPH)